MGKHKKRARHSAPSTRPSNSAVESTRKSDEAECSATASGDCVNKVVDELGQQMTNCQLTCPAEPWECFKAKANAEFAGSKFEEASNKYTLAIEELENSGIIKDRDVELAKLYGNRSLSFYKMSLAAGLERPQQQDLCLKALTDGGKAVHFDRGYVKGYFRCVSALMKLGRKKEAVEFLTKILDLYRSNQKDYHKDPYLVNLMTDCQYMASAKVVSHNWDKVKFKDNCVVLDPEGAGDVTTLTPELLKRHKKLSVLVKPGTYRCGPLVISEGHELDIIGDIGPDGSAKEIIFCCEGKGSPDGMHHVFAVARGTLSIQNVSIHQKSTHPEMHGIFIISHGSVNMRYCEGFSQSSGWIAVSNCGYLEMADSTIDGACGGVIVVEGSSAIIGGCFIKNCDRIGVEARSGGVVVVTNSEISKCGSQGLAAHADAGCCVVERCVFYANSLKLHNEADVSIARTIGVIRNSQITATRGTCIMVQEGARLELDECLLSGGHACVGLSLQGNALITRCKMANCSLGVMLAMNHPGSVMMKDNEINSREFEIGVSSVDHAPVFLGGKRHVVKNLDKGRDFNRDAKKHLKVKKEFLDRDQFVKGTEWKDPRGLPVFGRICSPCGLSQSNLARNFFACPECKVTWYCSKTCQEKDSEIHGPLCKKIREIWKTDLSVADDKTTKVVD